MAMLNVRLAFRYFGYAAGISAILYSLYYYGIQRKKELHNHKRNTKDELDDGCKRNSLKPVDTILELKNVSTNLPNLLPNDCKFSITQT